MCGIVAMYSPSEPISASSLEKATLRLAHRGPDGQRWWVSDDRRVGLGHARLSIIDLATGNQPIAGEDARLQIVVNGEFYDHDRIRKDLARRGHRLRTRSDSEIALHLYEDHGIDCLNHLRGEFAFVVWDGRENRLFAARDRFGIKPLYYAQAGGVLYLASEAKALFAAGIPARWDRTAFFQAMHHVAPTPDSSLFEGVSQVPPGHYLVCSSDRIELVRYWDFDYPRANEPRATVSDADYAESFRAALDEAVRLRMRADVPVGCYLSGGLDSSAVLGLAAVHSSEPIRAFTISFDRTEYDEGPIAREVARRAGATFHPVPVSQSDLADHFFEAVVQAENLAANAHGVAKWLLSRAVRDAGFKVVLTGEGADEILAGYIHFRRDMLLYDARDQDPVVVRELLEELQANSANSRPDGEAAALDGVRSSIGFAPSWLEDSAALAHDLRRLFSANFAAEFAGRDAFRELVDGMDVAGQLEGRAPLNQSLYLCSKVYLPNYVLVAGDRTEMAHSVEGRVPFLDHHVVELCRDLPVPQKIRGRIEKHVLREAARTVLPAPIYRRRKHGLVAPPAALEHEGRLFELAQDTLRGATLAALPFFDQAKVVALLDELPTLDDASRTAYDSALMILLSACALQTGYGLS